MNYFPVGKKQEFIPMFTTMAYNLSNVPNYSDSPAAAVVYKNEIHLLGGGDNVTENASHIKIDVKTDTATDVGTLPFKFDIGSAVVLNDEIHLLGSNREPTKHYKWDGKTWTKVSTIPFNVNYTVAVALNNEIHLIGGANNSMVHYKWDGETWTQLESCPASSDNSARAAVILNGKIHVLSNLSHLTWDGETWTTIGTLPNAMEYKRAVSSGDVIYIRDSSSAHYYYTWTESANKWINYKTLNEVVLNSHCNVYFGGWHSFNRGNPVTHTVAAVPVYIPID